jgi:hypothetical protein
LDALEQQIVQVVGEHPEYHRHILGEQALGSEWHPIQGETNPFLHLGMHLAIRDQIATNRPKGITNTYWQLNQQTNDPHHSEHLIMECLGEALWQAQHNQQPLDEQRYFACIMALIKA